MRFTKISFWAPLGFLSSLGAVFALPACEADPSAAGTGGTGTGGGTTTMGPSTGGTGTTASGGAATGSGGTSSNTGGTATATGGSSSGTGGTTGGGTGCAAADILCEDFESIAEGEIPTGGDWIARDSSCDTASFSMGVATDNPRGSSSKALKVTNHSYAQCRLATAIGTHDDFWVRAFIYWAPEVDFASKEILALDLLPAEGVGKDDPAVRFGNRSKDPCTGVPGPQVTMIGLGGGEATGCNDAVPIPKGEWYCFEAHIQQSEHLLANTYIDGTALQYQSSGKPLVDTVDLGQAPSSKIDHLRMGMFTHNSSGMGDVYIDDVAVSTTRIGCD